MSFNFTPLPSSLKLKENSPPLSHHQTHSYDVMVRIKPDSEHHQNYLKDDETIIPPLDVMVRTKLNIENYEDNHTKTNHKRKLTQSQRKHIHYSKQIISHLGHSNREYKSFSTISIDKKASNASLLKLPSVNTLPHPYVIIDKTNKPFLPVFVYEITAFDHSSAHSQILKDVIMTLISLSQNEQEI
ncbi:hypothetical protein O181_118292 [Austropuccinia psidii MF-1]|uniref:Uncharacterized protein n=1 Tax=Austropuccinia psidii MF-1 TaxID=1389203 RepID=A0A9Q3KCY5_9BASI|nr:hypothetical protein [Austropuccinia psidii MF-1]